MDTSILSVIIVLAALIFIIFLIISCKCVSRKKKIGSSFENYEYKSIDHVEGPKMNAKTKKGKPKLTKPKVHPQTGLYTKNSGPSGLKNTKETCYINAMVQAMASSNMLIKAYEDLLLKCFNIRDSPKLRMLIKLLKNINSPVDRKKCVQENTNTLKEMMKVVEYSFEPKHDALHVLSALINTIQGSVQDILQNESMAMPPKIRMLHTYTKTGVPNEIHDHLAVVLSLFGDFGPKSGIRIRVLLDTFFSPSRIEDNSYETRIYFFEKVPEVLTIHILSNELDPTQGAFKKSQYHLRYKEKMTYKFDIQMKLDGTEIKTIGAEYQLIAIVHQMGQIPVGHYVTYRIHDGSWYLTNDEQIVRMSFSNDIIPYIMIYEKSKEEEMKEVKELKEEEKQAVKEDVKEESEKEKE